MKFSQRMMGRQVGSLGGAWGGGLADLGKNLREGERGGIFVTVCLDVLIPWGESLGFQRSILFYRPEFFPE